MKRATTRFFFGFFLSLLSCSLVWGQGSTAQISGTVTDASGAVLPGVEVTATQTGTGVSRTAVSNETGGYVLPNLAVGPYKLEAALPGFRSFVQTGIVLQVNSNPAINIALQVGQLTETIEVQANAAMVETRSTGVGQVMENSRILELPLVGRQVYDLVTLSGAAVQTGVASTGNRAAYPGTPTFSIAGSMNTGNTVTLDGAMHNDVASNTALPLPFPDALQEFKIEYSSLPAQYGFHSGAALNAVTKSGTNDFHGSLFEFVRNYKFNGRKFFATGKDFLKRNQFGGTIGGPIKGNKLFFFGGYQGTTTRQDAVGQRTQVPTAAMMTGDFTAWASTACRSGAALNIASPFIGNKVDPSLLSKAAINLAKRLPPAQDQCGLVEFGNPIRSNESQFVGKMDYNWSTGHQVFGRYIGAIFDQASAYSLNKNLLSTPARGSNLKVNSLVLGDTYLIGSKIVNSFRATWNRTTDLKKPASFFGASDLGVNIWNDPPDYMTLAVSGGGFSIGGAGSSYLHWAWTTGQLSDDISIVHGNHQLSFGGSVVGYQSNSHHSTFSGGIFTISSLSDFMIGRVQSLVQGLPYTLWVTNKYVGMYGQDSWKVKPNFTLSYGLRWEPFIPQQFDRLQQANTFQFDAFKQGIKTSQYVNAPPGVFYPGDPQFGSNGTSPIDKGWKQLAPRIGLVWDPMKDGKMVVRAGYGIFYDMQSAELNLATPQGPPWGGKVQTNPGGLLDDPYKSEPGGNPFPFIVSKNAPYPAAGVFTTFDHNTHPPYVQQWNLGIQRQVGKDWLVSASYIGNEIVHLYGSSELNPAVFFPGNANASGQCFAEGYVFTVAPNAVCSSTANTNNRRIATLINPVQGPKFSNIGKWDDGGTRSYNALLVSTEKRLSKGFSTTGNYTLSHCIGTAIGSGTLLQSSAGNGVYLTPTRTGDRGNCTAPGADIRHLVNGTGIINVPKFANPYMNAIASNWRVSGILNVQSGGAFTIVSGTDRALNGKNAATQYANQTSSTTYGNQCEDDLRQSTGFKCLWLNTAGFGAPDPGGFGNLRPGTVFGPGYWTLNASLSRIFKIKESQTVEFRAEGTNMLNHTNFASPNGNITNPQFGRIQDTRGDARVMQFGMKYLF